MMITAAARYAVIGNPVAHSRSPRIHALFAEATEQRMTYERLPAPLAGFVQTVREFRSAGGMGLSVTVPFKLECLAFAAAATERAQAAGAANTLAWRGDHWYADNTDGAGLENDLARNLAFDVGGRDVLVLGAGGAARGILAPLLAGGPRRVVIANRTPEKADHLATQFREQLREPTRLFASPLGALHDEPFSIVINATSAGLGADGADVPWWPPGIFARDALAYDLMYASTPTPFLRWAAGHGASRCADGLGMLVEQAALQFQLWRGILPATAPVLAQLRAELKS
ncbi:MAG: shikimate dehydrogenase [Betaproteobacteria bacterium]